VNQWLEAIPPLVIYLLVGGVVGIESLGIPVPGEIVLISAALLSAQHTIPVSPLWIGVAASCGAIIGDSIGFLIGRRWGGPLFEWLGRKFPSHFGPAHVAYAEKVFRKWGVFAVFFGRFIALLRIFAGPLSGALEMPYPRFLAANAAGGICWAGGLTAAIYYLGEVADKWFSRFSWIALIVAVLCGLAIGLVIRRRTNQAAERHHAELTKAESETTAGKPGKAQPSRQ
ncbi:MAG TPA: DedA family protein, partial [Pseudonocardiaceae bacterium]|nr:DedA family protein [Pseudonocardiaceae bacterium]